MVSYFAAGIRSTNCWGKKIHGRYLGLRRTKEAEMWRRETSKNVAEIPFGKAGNFAKKTYFIGVSR